MIKAKIVTSFLYLYVRIPSVYDILSVLVCHFFVTFPGMAVNGFTNLFLLTLERRFQLSSTEAGFVAASNDIAGIVLTSLVSFYGTYGNKIRWLGCGSVVTSKNAAHVRERWNKQETLARNDFFVVAKVLCMGARFRGDTTQTTLSKF